MDLTWMGLIFTLAVAGVTGFLVFLVTRTWLMGRHAAAVAGARAEAAVLRERVVDLEAAVSEDHETAAMIAPLRHSLQEVARQVRDLERDRGEQFSKVALELTRVTASTAQLRTETASLVGSLNASSVRGSWGEVQLRRVLEVSGMLARCDFDEQVSVPGAPGTTGPDAAVTAERPGVRPDVVVRLPGDKCLVLDAKAPMTAFLAAQADDLTASERSQLLSAHAKALQGHVEGLAAKAYWSALPVTPEMVVCFVPGEAFLSAALASDPGLHEHAMSRRVVLASPGTLLALLRTVAFTWQQETLTDHARELLSVGRELHDRVGQLGRHAASMGAALRRSVESYNAFVGSLESRVLVSARRMEELGLVADPVASAPPLIVAPRPLTALELLDALEPDVARPELDLRSAGAAADGEPQEPHAPYEPRHGRDRAG